MTAIGLRGRNKNGGNESLGDLWELVESREVLTFKYVRGDFVDNVGDKLERFGKMTGIFGIMRMEGMQIFGLIRD